MESFLGQRVGAEVCSTVMGQSKDFLIWNVFPVVNTNYLCLPCLGFPCQSVFTVRPSVRPSLSLSLSSVYTSVQFNSNSCHLRYENIDYSNRKIPPVALQHNNRSSNVGTRHETNARIAKAVPKVSILFVRTWQY